jgi:predicted membrane protein
MSLISIILALVVAGVVLWLINTYIPMDGKIKSILNIVVVIIVILWLLSAFGVLGSQEHVHMGKFHMWW